MTNNETKKLYRSKSDRIIAGVCGGLGEYLDIDPVFIRLAFFFLTLIGGTGIIIYLVMFIVVPEEGEVNKPGLGSEEIKQRATELSQTFQKNGNSRVLLGVFLIALGLIFLFNSIFPNFLSFNQVWPILLIVIGLVMIADKKKK